MNTETLPDDKEALKKIVADYQQQVVQLQEKVDFLQRALHSPKSDKKPKCGLNETWPFLPGLVEDEQQVQQPKEEVVTVPEHSRRKRGRKPIPKDLPRKEILHDLSEEEKVCFCGCTLSFIGEEVSEKLDYIPAKLQVERHVRKKYACRECEGTESDQGAVKTASMPAQLVPQGIVTPGLMAHIITAKFVDGQPFYRQEKQFRRLGIELSRSTMVSWAIYVARLCEPFMDLFKQELKLGFYIGIDETPVQVLKEPGRSNTSKSYMWVFLGGSPENPIVLYEYHPTRSGIVLDFLKDYQGYIQSDGYAAYNELKGLPEIIHVGCLAHVRRKFMDVVKIAKQNKGGTAQEILDYIDQLYRLEQSFKTKKLKPDRILQERQEKSVPILNKIKEILDERKSSTPPSSKLGIAINYALNQWDSVTRYTLDGRLSPDNNLVENAIRPFALGRKNWLFKGHPNGAHAGALYYSLVETAKKNGLEPYAYLRYLFVNLPLAETEQDLKDLMPQNIDPAHLPSPHED